MDTVKWKGTISERQRALQAQDVVTPDNVGLKVKTVVFYSITASEKSVYRTRDPFKAVRTTITGTGRSELGRLDMDTIQSNRSGLNENIRAAPDKVMDGWGIEVTRTEITDAVPWPQVSSLGPGWRLHSTVPALIRTLRDAFAAPQEQLYEMDDLASTYMQPNYSCEAISPKYMSMYENTPSF